MKKLMLLFLAMPFLFVSCGGDDDDLGKEIGLKKGVHKIEVTVTATSDNISTVLVFSGIGKDGINANATLYNESGEKSGDGSDVRTITNGVGKFVCYTASDATGLMGNIGVVCHDQTTTAKVTCVGYLNDKEVSRIEKTFSSTVSGQLSIQTFDR